MKKLLFILLVGFMLVGCAAPFHEQMARIHADMSEKEVIDILGRPDTFMQDDMYIVLKYVDRPMVSEGRRFFGSILTGGMALMTEKRTDYVVILKDGKVITYGVADIHRPTVVPVLPLK